MHPVAKWPYFPPCASAILETRSIPRTPMPSRTPFAIGEPQELSVTALWNEIVTQIRGIFDKVRPDREYRTLLKIILDI